MKFSYIFYESGLAINVMYALNDPKKRAVGFQTFGRNGNSGGIG
jgi:hypothetical protein